ncbi:hypothetical protein K7X08_002093 [Anisodus acutangulus]|uniref:HECT-type E3 ubiquitin transferase n=1 Tax=Anisodus acutangulus TaxID=402998 RepID=A0A9Q1LNV0_9SOLA|nr:hypothetical protein K7X08_002093 [Anisodus acutangulus]
MSLINFLLISTKILLSCSFWIFCRPSVTLLCPLYASIRAIESDEASSYQKCLQYWVLFGLNNVLELTLAMPLTGFSFWRYAKGLASLVLVLPQFGAASYVYINFVKPCFSPDPRIEKITEKNDCMPTNCSHYIDATSRHVEQNEKDNLQSLVVYEAASSLTCDRTIYPKKVQMDWSCALCLVSTSMDDLRANTEYSGYSPASPVIQWFWEVIQAFSKEDKARLLQFVTGTSKVPLEGFSALQGISGSQKFQIHKAYGSPDHLPSAHTCFNQLDLPEYPSKEHLEERLLLAIHEANEGFGFG